MLSVGQSISNETPGYTSPFHTRAIEFTDGDNDLFQCNVEDLSLTIAGNVIWTLSFWMRPTADASSTSGTHTATPLISFGWDYNVHGIRIYYSDGAGDSEKLHFQISSEDNVGDTSDSVLITGDLDHDTWYHITIEYNGAGGLSFVKSYVNNVLVANHNMEFQPKQPPDGEKFIVGGGDFTGSIGDIIIIQHPTDPTEGSIGYWPKLLYNNGTAQRKIPTPVSVESYGDVLHWWTMEELEIFEDGDNYKVIDMGQKASAATCLDDNNTWDGTTFERWQTGFTYIGDKLPKKMLQFHRDNSEYMNLDGPVTGGMYGDGSKFDDCKWDVWHTGFSLGIWFKLDNTSGTHYLYSEQGRIGSMEFSIWIEDGTPKLKLGHDITTTNDHILTSDTDISDTDMHFLLVTYDHQSPYTSTMYLDNTSVATENQQVSFSNTDTENNVNFNHVYIANYRTDWSTNGLVGSIAYVIGWQGVLDSGERTAAYNSGTVPSYFKLASASSTPYPKLELTMGNYGDNGLLSSANPRFDNYYETILEGYRGDASMANKGFVSNQVIDLAGVAGFYDPNISAGTTWRRDGFLSDARVQDEDSITTTDGINLVDIP